MIIVLLGLFWGVDGQVVQKAHCRTVSMVGFLLPVMYGWQLH
jgi:hypothetical protein